MGPRPHGRRLRPHTRGRGPRAVPRRGGDPVTLTAGAAGAVFTPAPLRPWIGSEVGRLRTVLVHRPGRELDRLTPANMRSLLFDDLPWTTGARDEHDLFAAALRSCDVEVLYLRELLADVLEEPATRAALTSAAVGASPLGPTVGTALGELLDAATTAELAEWLIA